MKMMMDYLADADVLLGDQAALRILTSGSHGNTTNNVFYFAGRVVDKLWQGRDSLVFVGVYMCITKVIVAVPSNSKRLN